MWTYITLIVLMMFLTMAVFHLARRGARKVQAPEYVVILVEPGAGCVRVYHCVVQRGKVHARMKRIVTESTNPSTMQQRRAEEALRIAERHTRNVSRRRTPWGQVHAVH